MVFAVTHGFGPNPLAEVNFRFACRVYVMSIYLVPMPLYEQLEQTCFEETDGDPVEFMTLFEERLFIRYPHLYDWVVDHLL